MNDLTSPVFDSEFDLRANHDGRVVLELGLEF